MRAANNTQYFPEWLASSFGQLDTNRAFRLGGQPPQQLEHTFGVSSRPRQVALSDEPFWWALRETDPDASAAEFSFGNTTLEVQQLYRSLLLLASGLQMAGPSLTPASFELGLQRTTFPNPNHPIMAGDVGFTGGSHAMTVDGVEWWFGVGARSPYSGDEVGSICYVDGGARHTEGAWPSDGDPFFTGECDSGA